MDKTEVQAINAENIGRQLALLGELQSADGTEEEIAAARRDIVSGIVSSIENIALLPHKGSPAEIVPLPAMSPEDRGLAVALLSTLIGGWPRG